MRMSQKSLTDLIHDDRKDRHEAIEMMVPVARRQKISLQDVTVREDVVGMRRSNQNNAKMSTVNVSVNGPVDATETKMLIKAEGKMLNGIVNNDPEVQAEQDSKILHRQILDHKIKN